MFDVDLAGGESYRESRTYRAGELAVISDLPWGRLGLTICYDLRFPALYRALAEAGASFLAIPSAFTQQTGEAHWHVLMRARAIENGCFVFAAAQGGKHENGRETFGHSLIVDPWGRILAEGGTEPGVVMAEIDPAEVAAARVANSLAATRPPLRTRRADGGADTSARGAGRRHDPLRAQLRSRPRIRKLVSELGCLRQAGQARSWWPARFAAPPKSRRRSWRRGSAGAREAATAATPPSPAPPTASAAAAAADAADPDKDAGRDDVAAGARIARKSSRNCATTSPRMRAMSGRKFPEEARKMHYGETEHRSIYGEASPDEAKELHEEGIEFHPLPILPDDRTDPARSIDAQHQQHDADDDQHHADGFARAGGLLEDKARHELREQDLDQSQRAHARGGRDARKRGTRIARRARP